MRRESLLLFTLCVPYGCDADELEVDEERLEDEDIDFRATCPTSRNDEVLDVYQAPFNQESWIDRYRINQRKRAVVSLQSKKRSFYPNKACSGTLIADNWILTAAHCVENDPYDRWAIFDAETENGNDDFASAPRYAVTGTLEQGTGGWGGPSDYAIVQVEGNPAQELGITPTPVKFYTPGYDDKVYLIGHPFLDDMEAPQYNAARANDPDYVLPRRYAIGRVFSTADSYGEPELRTTALSAGASSGAGILDASGHLIGVHYSSPSAGCSKSANAWLNQRHSYRLRQLQSYSQQEFAVHVRAVGVSTARATMQLSCGSSTRQNCEVQVTNTGAFDDDMRAGCAVSCRRNATVTATCTVDGSSRNTREVKEMRRYHVAPDDIGEQYNLYYQGDDCWETSSCVRDHTITTTNEIRCEYDVR